MANKEETQATGGAESPTNEQSANRPAKAKNEEEEELEEELELLKAEKVDDLINKIYKNGKLHSRLVYLTNWQAKAMMSRNDSVKRMVESLYGKNTPRLVIHLLQSWGFYNSTKLMDSSNYNTGFNSGIEYDTPPFKDNQDMNKTMLRLTFFVNEVILPLAERTNAIILCNAVANDCVLTETLMNLLEVKSSRWMGGRLPFTVIKLMNQIKPLYYKEIAGDGNEVRYKKDIYPSSTENIVHWTSFMEKSKKWSHRHDTVLKDYFLALQENDPTEKRLRGHDLDWSPGNLIVVEGLDKVANGQFKTNITPANELLESILQTFSHIPTLGFKTGATPRTFADNLPSEFFTLSWRYAVARVNAGMHVVCLDVRERGHRVSKKKGRDDTSKKKRSDDVGESERSNDVRKSVQVVDLGDLEQQTIGSNNIERGDDAGAPERNDVRDRDHMVDHEDLEEQAIESNNIERGDDVGDPERDDVREKDHMVDHADLEEEQEKVSNDIERGDDVGDPEGGDVSESERSDDVDRYSYHGLTKKIWDESLGSYPRFETLDCCAVSFLGTNIKKKEKDRKEQAMKELKEIRSGLFGLQSEKKLVEKQKRSLKDWVKFLGEQQGTEEQIFSDENDREYIQFSIDFVSRFLGQFGRQLEKNSHYMASDLQALLRSEQFHCRNIWDSRESILKYIDENILLKYHRPTTLPPLEGLKLLKRAWENVDKTSMDAAGYRRVSYFLFSSQLCLGLLLTIFTAATIQWSDDEHLWKDLTLSTSLVLTALVSIESLLMPKIMWRQLRLASVELESLIWKYRAGVDKFRPGLDTSRNAESDLEAELAKWNDHFHGTSNYVGGTMVPQTIKSLSSSVLPSCIFPMNHVQWTSEKQAYENEDDHYSYIAPNDYLKFRLQGLIKIYQSRVPKLVLSQRKWQLVVIALGVVIAFITESDVPGRLEIILILTAIAAAVKSWSGFVDIEGHMQLYPPAINTLDNKRMQWEKRTKQQQHDLELCDDLVITVEGIAVNVVESWSKSLSENKTKIPNFDGNKGKNGSKSKVATGFEEQSTTEYDSFRSDFF